MRDTSSGHRTSLNEEQPQTTGAQVCEGCKAAAFPLRGMRLRFCVEKVTNRIVVETLNFPNGRSARAVRVPGDADATAILSTLALGSP